MEIRSLAAYFQERFPLINMALFAILFWTVYAVAHSFSPATGVAALGWREALGVLATVSFFFRLRVFDEIKDYALDAVNYPGRVLQSGRVKLQHLIGLAVAGTVVELSWALLMGLPALLCWLPALGYSLLMRYEFFAPSFLKKRLLLYALTHMLVMPLIILWLWAAYAAASADPASFWLLALLSLLGGFSFEMARKIHVKEAEREGVDSYSKSVGYVQAVVLVLTILLAGVGVQSYLLLLLQAGSLPFLLLGILYAATLALYGYAIRSPQERTVRLAEIFVSLFMLVSYLSVILVVYV